MLSFARNALGAISNFVADKVEPAVEQLPVIEKFVPHCNNADLICRFAHANLGYTVEQSQGYVPQIVQNGLNTVESYTGLSPVATTAIVATTGAAVVGLGAYKLSNRKATNMDELSEEAFTVVSSNKSMKNFVNGLNKADLAVFQTYPAEFVRQLSTTVKADNWAKLGKKAGQLVALAQRSNVNLLAEAAPKRVVKPGKIAVCKTMLKNAAITAIEQSVGRCLRKCRKSKAI